MGLSFADIVRQVRNRAKADLQRAEEGKTGNGPSPEKLALALAEAPSANRGARHAREDHVRAEAAEIVDTMGAAE